MLQKMGFVVSVADTGTQAVKIFSESPDDFDLVVLDFLMPEVHGSEVHELLRLQNPDIMILFACGIFYFDHMIDMLKYAVNGFIQKPFSYNQLKRKVDRLLGAKLSGSF